MAIRRRWRVGVLVACLALLATACSKSSDTNTGDGGGGPATTSSQGGGSEFDLSGTWDGAWQNQSPDNSVGDFTIKWVQTGSSLTGTILVTGTPCITTGTVTGTLNGGQISFGAVKGSATIDYTGAVTATTMQGTYKTSCGNAEGTFGAKLSS